METLNKEIKMKKLLIAAIIFLLPVGVFATNITFTSSGSIVNGNVFSSVSVQNDGTVINMTGGQIKNLWTYNISTFNMSGGIIEYSVHTGLSSSFNFSGGTIIGTNFEFGGNVNISGGSITGGGKFANLSNTVVNITGGNLNFSLLMPYGELNIYGGLLNIDDFYLCGGTTNIFGYGFNYDSNRKVLTGYLLDHNQFTINNLDSTEYQHLNLVPEPVSLLLFGFGLLALRKQK
jgi:hypothetical protein